MTDSSLYLPLPPTTEELAGRCIAARTSAETHGGNCFVCFNPANIFYFTGYAFTPTERPIAAFIDPSGEPTLWVPLLKSRHAELSSGAKIESYPEYPEKVHPMRRFADLVRSRGGRMAAVDLPGYPSIQGYQGPDFAECFGEAVTLRAPRLAEHLRMRKSSAEQALIAAGCSWSAYAHRLLHDAIHEGLSESAVSGPATGAAMAALRRAMQKLQCPPRPYRVFAGFGGQVGADGTAHHYQRSVDPELGHGDLLITQVGAVIGGYYSELERTMLIGTPSIEARDLFRAGEDMQAFAIDLIRPGITCAQVDAAVCDRFERENLQALWRHHTGHSIGLEAHEAPFLDIGDDTVLQAGMIVTVEPGLYRDGVGGFRHSDCVLVTKDGHQVLTDYPRNLASLSVL